MGRRLLDRQVPLDLKGLPAFQARSVQQALLVALGRLAPRALMDRPVQTVLLVQRGPQAMTEQTVQRAQMERKDRLVHQAQTVLQEAWAQLVRQAMTAMMVLQAMMALRV